MSLGAWLSIENINRQRIGKVLDYGVNIWSIKKKGIFPKRFRSSLFTDHPVPGLTSERRAFLIWGFGPRNPSA